MSSFEQFGSLSACSSLVRATSHGKERSLTETEFALAEYLEKENIYYMNGPGFGGAKDKAMNVRMWMVIIN